MTRFVKHALLLFLAGVLFLSSLLPFPPSHFNSIDWGASINLKDVVLSAKDIAASASNPAVFERNFRQFCSTVQVVAGIRTVIRQNDTKLYSMQNQVFLLNQMSTAPELVAGPILKDEDSHHLSTLYAPALRPPIFPC